MPDKLVACLREGFDEVLGVSGEHRPVTSPLAESERVVEQVPDEGDGPNLRAVH